MNAEFPCARAEKQQGRASARKKKTDRRRCLRRVVISSCIRKRAVNVRVLVVYRVIQECVAMRVTSYDMRAAEGEEGDLMPFREDGKFFF